MCVGGGGGGGGGVRAQALQAPDIFLFFSVCCAGQPSCTSVACGRSWAAAAHYYHTVALQDRR